MRRRLKIWPPLDTGGGSSSSSRVAWLVGGTRMGSIGRFHSAACSKDHGQSYGGGSDNDNVNNKFCNESKCNEMQVTIATQLKLSSDPASGRPLSRSYYRGF
ncbi:GL24308 [Drosophila persimilis]|uniref:GL24308 n=1 Tax=Drosophila persimilis TaxID=7234 RepID=B4G571_DROPE|nr:GL24308 [Drosophila persimilis]